MLAKTLITVGVDFAAVAFVTVGISRAIRIPVNTSGIKNTTMRQITDSFLGIGDVMCDSVHSFLDKSRLEDRREE